MRKVLRFGGFAACGALLAWCVITTSFTAYLARTDPAAALRLQPDHPVALVAQADLFFQAGRTNVAYEMAEAALRVHPLDADALSLLGQIADGRGDDARASKFMTAAAEQSLHSSIAIYWMMRILMKKQEFPAVLRFADALFRTRPDVIDSIAPGLGALAEDPAARPHLLAALAADPPWRSAFLMRLCLVLSDTRTMLGILLDLADTSAPPSPPEINAYLDVLIARGLAEFAYHAWLQLLPSDRLAGAGLLFNGAFSQMPSGSPFDWRITPGVGAIIEIARYPDGIAPGALKLSFGPGRVDLGDVAQIVVLQPGRYRLQGRESTQLTGRRGLQWGVACSDGTTLGSMAPISKSEALQSFEIAFAVPAIGCPFQIVRLAFDPRRPLERLMSGTALYADMKIIRYRTEEK